MIRALALLVLSGCGGQQAFYCSTPQNHIQLRPTDVCNGARAGVEICPRGCNSGYGYRCDGACWHFFADGPCAPGGNCGAQ